MSTNLIVPILYRCDEKYKFFLVNSILSVLKYYKGEQLLYFYICTNDNLDLSQLEIYKQKYKFKYEIITINNSFFETYGELKKHCQFATKKYFGFNFEELCSADYNSIYQFNPFSRSKSIIASVLFYMAICKHERVILLDTDTIVVDNIANLLQFDISNYICSSCTDWGNNSTKFNPSVSVWNITKYKEAFFREKGVLDQLIHLSSNKLSQNFPYCEAVQKMINDVVDNKVLFIDKKWNVPITHMHLYPEPKIYHFSESWTGNEKIQTMYNVITTKYLGDERYKYF